MNYKNIKMESYFSVTLHIILVLAAFNILVIQRPDIESKLVLRHVNPRWVI